MRKINTLNAPKTRWIVDFLRRKHDYLSSDTGLSDAQLAKFKAFLRCAGLLDGDNFTELAELASEIGWRTAEVQAIIVSNLTASNGRFKWFAEMLKPGVPYSTEYLVDSLIREGVNRRTALADVRALKCLINSPMGTRLHWAEIGCSGEIFRSESCVPVGGVVLYDLFRQAEAGRVSKELHLSTYVDACDTLGISYDNLKCFLLGLSAKYPEFISVSFTHDLEKITLAEDKSSRDVLELIREES